MMLAGLGAFGILYAAQPVLPQISEEFGVSSDPGRPGGLRQHRRPGAVRAAGRRAGDPLGPRPHHARPGCCLAVLLTLLAAAAPTFGSLILLRALAGAVLAGVVAVAMGHVGSETHPSGLGSAMGLYVAGNSLGGVGGRLLTAAVADATSWRWGVGLLAAAALVVTVAFWRLLPEPVALDEEDPREDADGGHGSARPPASGRWSRSRSC